ncbi:MAG TPA: hypothetical protein DCZ00_05795 [Lactococcus sp.]|uniref:hypothetical protein n=1 Tax=Lactococcus TaxID=1357 RepID=UPI000E8DEA75|nr:MULTISPECIES: hypothetical protein [Lactococcus]HAP15101.1 hypothetical protein [Lactococcus sp.]HBC90941.1 hypothetical protein [Lactococcus sp.]
MKTPEGLINDLRDKYLELSSDIARAEIASVTLMLDQNEHDMLYEQILCMKSYAKVVKSRANYARLKSEGLIKDTPYIKEEPEEI